MREAALLQVRKPKTTSRLRGNGMSIGQHRAVPFLVSRLDIGIAVGAPRIAPHGDCHPFRASEKGACPSSCLLHVMIRRVRRQEVEAEWKSDLNYFHPY